MLEAIHPCLPALAPGLGCCDGLQQGRGPANLGGGDNQTLQVTSKLTNKDIAGICKEHFSQGKDAVAVSGTLRLAADEAGLSSLQGGVLGGLVVIRAKVRR
jgi:hypothetical protein